MRETRFLLRFTGQLRQEFRAVTKPDKVFGLVVVIGTIYVAYLRHGLTEDIGHSLRAGGLAIFWTACIFLGYYSIKSAVHLHRENLRSWRDFRPIIIGGTPPSRPSHWQGTVFVGILCLVLLATIISTASIAKSSLGQIHRALAVTCSLGGNASPCELYCSAKNHGQMAIRDVVIGFNGFLPAETRVSAPPETKVRFEKSAVLPLPDPNGRIDYLLRAFTITIPLLPPNSEFPIALWTVEDNNRRACAHVLTLNKIRRKRVGQILAFVASSGLVTSGRIPNLDVVLLANSKRSALFMPDAVLSDHGSERVEFITATEQRALDLQQEIYNLKPKFMSLIKFEGKEDCEAPVFLAEQTGGQAVPFAVLLPDVTTHAIAEMVRPRGGGRSEGRPIVPQSYVCREE